MQDVSHTLSSGDDTYPSSWLAGEKAQLIIEEVANLLCNSSSAGAAAATSAEQLQRMGSARSSLTSDPERSASAEPPSASSLEQPLLWDRLTHSPSAPMPLRGGLTPLLPQSLGTRPLRLPDCEQVYSRSCQVQARANWCCCGAA